MSQPDFFVRAFLPKDAEALATLTTELGYPTTTAQMTTRMEAISALADHWTFVAVSEGVIAGYVGMSKQFFWEQDGHFIRIQALVVKKEFRRHGVGKLLIETAEQLAGFNDAKMLMLNCGNREERQSAHLFYPEMGFEAKSTGYVKRMKI